MFYTDETVRQQKMKDMKAEVEYGRMRKRQKKEKQQTKRSLWIVIVSLLHLQKKK